MPKLALDWEWDGKKPFLEMGVNVKPFVSHLPSAETLSAASLDSLFGVSQNEFAGMSFDNWADTSVRSLFNVANTWGSENFQIPSLGNFANEMVGLVNLPAGVTAEEAAAGVIVEAVDVAMQAIAIIPVYGWIINGAWKIGRGIYETVQFFKKSDPEVPMKALTFDSGVDSTMTNIMLGTTAGTDWTRIFLPGIRTFSFETKAITWGKDDDGTNLGGYSIRPTPGAVSDQLDGLGVLPGVPEVFSTFQVPKAWPGPGGYHTQRRCVRNWQSGGEWTAAPGVNLCKTTGDFLPTVQQLGLTLWSMVRTGDANAFKVDQNTIAGEWEDYFASLVDYYEFYAAKGDWDGPNGNDWQKAYAIQDMAVIGMINTGDATEYGMANGAVHTWGVAENVPGFHDFVREIAAYNSPGAFIKKIPENLTIGGGKFHQGMWWITVGALVRFMIQDQLKACYNRFLNTIVVAYVDDSFPAIGGPNAAPMMKDRWAQNRAKLLNSTAVKQVELDLIPDDGYRALVHQSQQSGAWSISAAPEPGVIDDVAAGPDEPVYPHPPPIPMPKPGEEKTWLERYGPWLAGGLAIAGAGYLGYRAYKRRKPNGLYLPPGVE